MNRFRCAAGKKIPVRKIIGTILVVLPMVWLLTHMAEYRYVTEIWHKGRQLVLRFRWKVLLMSAFTLQGLVMVWFPCFLSRMQRRVYAIATFFVTSVVMIFALEFAGIWKHRTIFMVLERWGFKKFLLTWLVVILFASWFLVLTNRWHIAAVLTAVSVCVLGVTSYLVYKMRGTPFLATDLAVLGTAMNVAADYEYKLDYYTLALVSFTITWCYTVSWAGPARAFRGWKLRTALAGALIGLTLLGDYVYIHTDMLPDNQVTMNPFLPEKSYGKQGTILAILRSFQLTHVKEPEGYSLDRVKEIESRYGPEEISETEADTGMFQTESAEAYAVVSRTESASKNVETSQTKSAATYADTPQAEPASENADTRTNPGANAAAFSAKASGKSFQPNIIIVMDEAFCDLQEGGDFQTDQEVCPFFRNLTENTIRGKLYVSSFGGRTANTEYEVLTGDSVGFTPMGTAPYQEYIKGPMPSLVSTLENAGYHITVGMHPFLKSGYNRYQVYQYFGFDKLIFFDEFENPEYVHGRISDMEDVDRVISEYEEAKAESDAPFFIHNVTMQNHSPYSGDADALGDPVHVVTGKDESYPDADVYLTLIRKSDQAFEKLVRYFEAVDDPTVILFYGDHQPALGKDFYKMIYGKPMSQMKGEGLLQYYYSEYRIWANFDIEEKEMDLSTNYLIPVMKEAVGMELTGYDRFLLDLHEDLPILTMNGYWDKNGTFCPELLGRKSEWYDRVHEYHLLSYNHLIDAENCTLDFFGGTVPENKAS